MTDLKKFFSELFIKLNLTILLNMLSYNFSGKTALISGGSSGLGLATATALAQAGARIVIVSRNPYRAEATFKQVKGDVHYYSADFEQPSEINPLFEQIESDFSRLDFAINCAAGDSGIGKPVTGFTEEEFDSTINVNLKSLWLCMKHEILLMQKTGSGCIVNVSSVNGLGGVEGGSLYAASKAAVIALSKSAALELAQTKIAVHAIIPGAFDTPLLQKAMEAQTGGKPDKLPHIRQQYEQAIPAGRIGDPKEFAETILWLCTARAPYMAAIP